MEFVILIIINIFLGTVFYLIISLKLEKSASEFREKKLRKFMDDIIQEFNATAERNISLLENKIVIMKNLLEKLGDVKAINIEIGDDRENGGSIGETEAESTKRIEGAGQEKIGDGDPAGESFHVFDNSGRSVVRNDKFTDYLIILKERAAGIVRDAGTNIINYLQNIRGGSIRNSNRGEEGIPIVDTHSDIPVSRDGINADRVGKNFDALIERDYSEIQEKLSVDSEDTINDEMNEKELSDLFSASEDKYSLISDLYVRGYTVDTISKCSGIPIGEVRLVLNLNNP